jgi:colanic acid/amylovoran biosynthesis glycosyltransferase
VRVLLSTYAFPDDRQAFIEEYVRALLTLGTEVCVVATAGSDRHVEPQGSSLLTVVSASWSDPRRRKVVTLAKAVQGATQHHRTAFRRLVGSLRRRHGLGHSFLSRLYVLSPMLSRPVDVTHLGWLTAAADWTELLPLVEGPLVVSCHGSDLRIDPLEDNGYRERLAAVFARVDVLHCVSRDLAARAVALGLDPAKVLVRAWGVDTERFRPSPALDSVGPTAPQSRPLRVVSIGRLHSVKGYEFALLALAQVRRSGVNVEYTIIGGGTERDRLPVLASVRDLGLEDCVHLAGARTHAEVLEALRESDIFLLSSLSEGLNTATLEAMAVGLPVVVTDVGGMSEAVTDGIEGRVVPPRDAHALADAILELASNATLRAAMGERGRRRAVDDFDTNETARIMVEQYRSLIDASRRRTGCATVG